MLGHGVVPREHPLPPVLLELLTLAVELGAEFGELLLELLGGAGSVDRRLALCQDVLTLLQLLRAVDAAQREALSLLLGLVPLRVRHLDEPLQLEGGVDGDLPGGLGAAGRVRHLLLQGLVGGLQGLKLVA